MLNVLYWQMESIFYQQKDKMTKKNTLLLSKIERKNKNSVSIAIHFNSNIRSFLMMNFWKLIERCNEMNFKFLNLNIAKYLTYSLSILMTSKIRCHALKSRTKCFKFKYVKYCINHNGKSFSVQVKQIGVF